MSEKKGKLERVRGLVEPVVAREGFELVEAELVSERGAQILRLYIDTIPPSTKERGVSVEQCSQVSRALSEVLDADESLSEQYTLEVSSPGLFRPLTKPDHYQRALGQRVKVKTYDKLHDRRAFIGMLRKVGDGNITVDVDGVEYSIALEKVAKANLEPVL
ncbi:MAG: ribosome maturation factor RimP [Myxococcota bacterium]